MPWRQPGDWLINIPIASIALPPLPRFYGKRRSSVSRAERPTDLGPERARQFDLEKRRGRRKSAEGAGGNTCLTIAYASGDPRGDLFDRLRLVNGSQLYAAPLRTGPSARHGERTVADTMARQTAAGHRAPGALLGGLYGGAADGINLSAKESSLERSAAYGTIATAHRLRALPWPSAQNTVCPSLTATASDEERVRATTYVSARP